MDVVALLTSLGAAVSDAKVKAEHVESLKASLAAYVAERQADIDEAEAAYNDAKIAVDRLQEQGRDVIGVLLPAPDPRFRQSR